jgi:serine/threonine protein kinase
MAQHSEEIIHFSDRYREGRFVGGGGMGSVYKAIDTVVGNRAVAIKLLRPPSDDPQVRGRLRRYFEQEIRLLISLEHPYIVRIYDAGTFRDTPFFVMQWLEGGSLADRLRKGRLSLGECVHWFEQIASAVDFAHRRGVIHRDLKPSNILFNRSPIDNLSSAILTDFGIAKLVENENGSATFTLTRTGLAPGTIRYMPPEAFDNAPVAPSRDIFALGVILFEMLTGQALFDGEPTQIMRKIIFEPPPLPSTIVPSLPRAVDSVVLKALAKKPEDRFQTAAELVEALKKAVDTRPEDGNVSIKPVDRKRRPLAWIALAITFSVIVLLGLILLVLNTRTDSAAMENKSAAAQPSETVTPSPTMPVPLIIIIPSPTIEATDGALSIGEPSVTPELPTLTPTVTDESATPTQQVFIVLPSPTGTPSPAATHTSTPTQTASATPTATYTATHTVTATHTATTTYTATATPSKTSTPSATVTLTPSQTFTLTFTATFTPTATTTPSVTTTPSPTSSSTPTFTPTPTSTPTSEYGMTKGFVRRGSNIEVSAIYTPYGWLNIAPVTVRQYRACYNMGACPLVNLEAASDSPLLLTSAQARDYCAWQFEGRVPSQAALDAAIRLALVVRIEDEWTQETLSDLSKKAYVRCLFER